MTARALASVAVVLVVAQPAIAHGQNDGGPHVDAGRVVDGRPPAAVDPTNASLTPPATIDMPPIAPPAGTTTGARAVEVHAVLTINARGEVTAVEVTRSGGAAYDQAVVDGARAFRFRPATQGGKPVSVRLPFTQRFEPTPIASPTAPRFDARIEGVVMTRGARIAVAGATLIAVDKEGRKHIAVSDRDGIFRLSVPSNQPLDLHITAAGHEKFIQQERLDANQSLRVKYLIDRKSEGQYESYVRAEADRTEVSRTTLTGREITRIPGTFGDPFRVIEVLPGVSSAFSLLPLPIVRGTSPGNTGFLLDGSRVPLLFHLLAGPSVIHPEFVDRIDFYPGGFPVVYGGYTGGLVDGITRSAHAGERRVDVDVTLAQTGVFVREPLPITGVTATVAGRIGYPGLLLKLLAPNLSLSYWDYQARVDGGADKNRWSVFSYGAQDVVKTREGTEPFKTELKFEFHRLDLRYQHGDDTARELYRVILGFDDSFVGSDGNSAQAGTDGDNNTVAGAGPEGNSGWSVKPQLRLHRAPTAWFDLDLGLEAEFRTIAKGKAFPKAMPNPMSGTNSNIVSNPNGDFTVAGGFAQLVWKPTDRLRLIPGIRGDVYHQRRPADSVTKSGVDPRVLFRYRLGEKADEFWLKGMVGRYHQPPRIATPVPGIDSSSLELGLLASSQYSLGMEAKVAAAVAIDLNLYYNAQDPVVFDLDLDRGEPVSRSPQPQPATPAWEQPPPTPGVSAGTLDALYKRQAGRSYGLEVLLRKHDTNDFFGWISYTLSRSDRRKNQGWQPFAFDRRHIVNLVGGVRLPRNWEVGGRMLFQTGLPLSGDLGPIGARADGHFRFDLRIDKRAVWNRWLLDFYIDIVNTTLAADPSEGIGTRFVIPTLGFRAVL